jgi:hypothetical protein
VVLTSISVAPANPSLAVGSTIQFAASGTYSDGTSHDITTQVIWSSSNTSVATVNNSGLATALSAGSTNITSTSGNITGSTILTVMPCANVAGNWNYTNSGTVTCTVDGESETENPSGSGTIVINQNGCNISWTEPIYQVSRSGTISGNFIQVSGLFGIALDPGVIITQNIYNASGSVIGNIINLSGSGFVAGTYEGMSGSCTGTDSATFTR